MSSTNALRSTVRAVRPRSTSAEPLANDRALTALNETFAGLSAEERVAYALEQLPGAHVLSSSFGAQAAVSLHLLTSQQPDLPIVLIDTGYLFAETYQFVETLRQRLDLNLQIFRAEMSPAQQEALFGQRWTQGVEGIEAYNRQNKVEPMRRALATLNVGTWFSGLRRNQSSTRTHTPFVEQTGGRFKVAPIADWNDRDVYGYLKANDLPYHPLWEQGYVSIGDTHSTVPLHLAESAEATRFGGLKRECGLHDQAL